MYYYYLHLTHSLRCLIDNPCCTAKYLNNLFLISQFWRLFFLANIVILITKYYFVKILFFKIVRRSRSAPKWLNKYLFRIIWLLNINDNNLPTILNYSFPLLLNNFKGTNLNTVPYSILNFLGIVSESDDINFGYVIISKN